MQNTKLLPTKKVTQVTGTSGQTLKQYADNGLIDQPVFKSHGRAGASLYWDRGVLIQLASINALKATGRTLAEIEKIMKGEV